MKSLLLIVSLSVSTLAFADVKLLDCSIADGFTSQATVVKKTNGALSLKEITTHGAQLERPLTLKEWRARKISLFTPITIGSPVATLTQDKSKKWVFTLRSTGLNVFSLAECSTAPN